MWGVVLRVLTKCHETRRGTLSREIATSPGATDEASLVQFCESLSESDDRQPLVHSPQSVAGCQVTEQNRTVASRDNRRIRRQHDGRTIQRVERTASRVSLEMCIAPTSSPSPRPARRPPSPSTSPPTCASCSAAPLPTPSPHKRGATHERWRNLW